MPTVQYNGEGNLGNLLKQFVLLIEGHHICNRYIISVFVITSHIMYLLQGI